MEIATSTCPVESIETKASQCAPLKPHMLMFVDVPDWIPPIQGSRKTFPIRENHQCMNLELIGNLIGGAR
jgi:hypothetical protein